MATALAMSGSSSQAQVETAAIAPSAADAVYTELAAAPAEATAADAAWSDFESIDELADDETDEVDLAIDWVSDEE